MTKVILSELHKNVLNGTLVRLRALLCAESASLFLFDKEHEELVLNAMHNERKLHLEGIRQRVGEGIAGSVANERKALLVKDIKSDPRWWSNGHSRHYHTDSFICVPINTQHGLVGVISISDKVSGEPFTDKDFELACMISNLSSLVLESQIAVARLQEENEALAKEKAEIGEERVFLEKLASMGKLAGGVVHEINNPLDAVMRYTNILIEKDVDEAVAKEYLNEIKIGLTRIVKITRSLLEFAQQLKDNHRYEYVDVRDVLEEALSLFPHTLFTGHIKIEKDFECLMPKVVDKGLCRIFANLIKNAFDAMPRGGILKICAYQQEGAFIFSFKDTGKGIPDDIKEKIFTPFFTTKPIGQGVGLGLPICFEVVQRYEGKIEVDSEVDKGTEFKVRLPLKNLIP